mmetsp:Transcript_54713/g.62883  ORF Transcript_54713/g.62883 Transcript_54713/m.62883 type:complete len:367 (-) Transcript_54713:480-1580(-)
MIVGLNFSLVHSRVILQLVLRHIIALILVICAVIDLWVVRELLVLVSSEASAIVVIISTRTTEILLVAVIEPLASGWGLLVVESRVTEPPWCLIIEVSEILPVTKAVVRLVVVISVSLEVIIVVLIVERLLVVVSVAEVSFVRRAIVLVTSLIVSAESRLTVVLLIESLVIISILVVLLVVDILLVLRGHVDLGTWVVDLRVIPLFLNRLRSRGKVLSSIHFFRHIDLRIEVRESIVVEIVFSDDFVFRILIILLVFNNFSFLFLLLCLSFLISLSIAILYTWHWNLLILRAIFNLHRVLILTLREISKSFSESWIANNLLLRNILTCCRNNRRLRVCWCLFLFRLSCHLLFLNFHIISFHWKFKR